MRAERLGKLRGYKPEVIAKMKRFEPVWLPDADRILAQIHKWKKPKTIFMGFMGDITCQRNENIRYMLDVVRIHPGHRFLFLTKNIKHVLHHIEYFVSKNVWWGYSDDGEKISLSNWDWLFNQVYIRGWITNFFASFEPLIGNEAIRFPYQVRWVIIGALTDRRGQPVPPEKGGTRLEWVMPIIEVADKHNIPVFLKNNLLKLYPQLPLRQEFPWAK